jgi:hypothetical protein
MNNTARTMPTTGPAIVVPDRPPVSPELGVDEADFDGLGDMGAFVTVSAGVDELEEKWDDDGTVVAWALEVVEVAESGNRVFVANPPPVVLDIDEAYAAQATAAAMFTSV